jgi:hypothetical protein
VGGLGIGARSAASEELAPEGSPPRDAITWAERAKSEVTAAARGDRCPGESAVEFAVVSRIGNASAGTRTTIGSVANQSPRDRRLGAVELRRWMGRGGVEPDRVESLRDL